MALSEGSTIDLQVSSLRNMSVGLKKSPSNACEKLVTSDEQQAKVLVFCIFFLVWVMKMLMFLWKKSFLRIHNFPCLQINEVRRLIGPLSDKLSIYCSDASISRYLWARAWNVKKATKMLKDSLKWRLSYKPEEIRWVCFC